MNIKKYLFVLIAILLSILISTLVFILLEIIYNEICYDYNCDDFENYDKDAVTNNNHIIGYSMKPGNIKAYKDNLLKINKYGFRDIDFNLKNKETTKIVILGDSVTFGAQVKTEEMYSNVLSKILGNNYSVFNFGIDGYNTIQESEVLKTEALKYNPDIVIITFCPNDFDSNCDTSIYYCSRANFNKINAFVFYRSKIYRDFFIKLIKSIDGEDRTNIVEMYRKYGDIDVSNIQDDEIGIKTISELQKKYDFKCYFFILPYFRNFDNYLKKDERMHNRIKELLQKYPNIKYFDLKEDFMNISKDSSVFLYDDDDFIHPNEYGHKLIAEFIYEKLKLDGVLKNYEY